MEGNSEGPSAVLGCGFLVSGAIPSLQGLRRRYQVPRFSCRRGRIRTLSAYAVAAISLLFLTFVMGLGRRAAENMMAGLLRTATSNDGSDIVLSLLDAPVFNALWQLRCCP